MPATENDAAGLLRPLSASRCDQDAGLASYLGIETREPVEAGGAN